MTKNDKTFIWISDEQVLSPATLIPPRQNLHCDYRGLIFNQREASAASQNCEILAELF